MLRDSDRINHSIEKLARRVTGLATRKAVGWTPEITLQDVIEEIWKERGGPNLLEEALFPICLPSYYPENEMSDKFAILLHQGTATLPLEDYKFRTAFFECPLFYENHPPINYVEELRQAVAYVYDHIEMPQPMRDGLVRQTHHNSVEGMQAYQRLFDFITSREDISGDFWHYLLREQVHPEHQTEYDYLKLIATLEELGEKYGWDSVSEIWRQIRPFFHYVNPCCGEVSALDYVDRMSESDEQYQTMDKKSGLLYRIKKLDKLIAGEQTAVYGDHNAFEYDTGYGSMPNVGPDGQVSVIRGHNPDKQPNYFFWKIDREARAQERFYDILRREFENHYTANKDYLHFEFVHTVHGGYLSRILALCREELSPEEWQAARRAFAQLQPMRWRTRALGLSGLVQLPSALEMLTTTSDAWEQPEYYALLDELRETDRHFARKDGYDSLTDILCDVGIPEQALENRELWNYVKTIQQTGIVSRWKNFDAVTKDGRHVHIKISDNKARAQMEAAANYYLSSHMSFIVPGLYPEPLEANGVYVVVQEKLPETAAQIIPSVEYWMTAFAMFHREAEGILHTAGIEVPIVKLRSLDQLEEMYAEARTREIPFDKERVKTAIEYLEAGERCATHGDAKRDNVVGRYLIDLELTGKRHAAVDLAMVLMQYNVPREQWNAHLTMYARHKGGDVNKQVKELREAVEHAVVYTAFNEICGSSLRLITPQTARQNAVLTSYLSAA
jgi:thiamine kinase-like enzyme